MATKRPHYRTKAEWAEAQASALRQQATADRYTSSAGSTSRARRKYSGIANCHAEADRFSRMAERFRARGL